MENNGLWEARRVDDEVVVDLAYPRSDGEAKFVRVGLTDVRAADELRISYDFERDGWKVEQASNHGPWGGDAEPDEGWREVGFFKAWALAPITPEVPRP